MNQPKGNEALKSAITTKAVEAQAAAPEAGASAPAVVKAKKPQTVVEFLTAPNMKAQIAMALPKHLTADRFARVMLTEIRKVPKLGQCDKESFLCAVMQCAQLGIEPGGALGHAYLIPFENRKAGKTEVQFILGYKGMIDLARRSGQIMSLEARVIYEKDYREIEFGFEPRLVHKPAWEEADRGPMQFVYAIAKLKDGGTQYEIMSKAEVDKIKAKSKAGSYGPWVDHYEEMARKTVIRRLFKYLPVSIEMQQAITMDEQAEAGIPQDLDADFIEGTAETINSDEPAPAPAADTIDPTTGEVY